jgi:hypothetical protein
MNKLDAQLSMMGPEATRRIGPGGLKIIQDYSNVQQQPR